MFSDLARRLDRIENKLNPPDKPGITVIVVAAGEEKILHVLGRRRLGDAPKGAPPDD